MNNPIRPKVKAAAKGSGAGTGGAVVLTWLLRKAGVDLQDTPPEVLVGAAGIIAGAAGTLAAYVKRDGLKGAWQRLVNGQGGA